MTRRMGHRPGWRSDYLSGYKRERRVMALAERVNVTRRFQRAVRIDLDLGDPESLEGFICPQSSAEVLKTMARHVAESGQGAFTWTGPYGSGKSSLVVALSALLNGSSSLRQSAAADSWATTSRQTVWNAFAATQVGLAHPAGRRPPGAARAGGWRGYRGIRDHHNDPLPGEVE